MEKKFSIFIGSIALITVGIQLYLMIENKVASVPETIIRFFSFFTILTNLLVGIFFILYFLNKKNNTLLLTFQPGMLTSVTVYITIVGLVYQFALRHIWEPKGLQRITDELLHSIIPVLVILFWYWFENKKDLKYRSIFKWLIYPILYLIYILIRGYFSNFYPYPFVNVSILGISKVLFNSTILVFVFTSISLLFIKIGCKISKYN